MDTNKSLITVITNSVRYTLFNENKHFLLKFTQPVSKLFFFFLFFSRYRIHRAYRMLVNKPPTT